MTCARPWAWRRAYDAWRSAAHYPERIEFILFFDQTRGFHEDKNLRVTGEPQIVRSKESSTSISGWNAAAAASTGHLILLAHDDIVPPRGWDDGLRESLPPFQEEYAVVLETSPPDNEVTDFDMGALTRLRYDRLGYALFPGYAGSGELRELYLHAEMDTVIEIAPDLRFTHYHPKYGDGAWDEVYENRHRWFNHSDGLFQDRERSGFPPLSDKVSLWRFAGQFEE
jgi:hypothetical protein